jgi:hypothetical protein
MADEEAGDRDETDTESEWGATDGSEWGETADDDPESDGDGDGDDREWRFSVDEVGDDGDDGDDGADDDADGWDVAVDGEADLADATPGSESTADEGGNVAGSLVQELPVESGTPDAENAAFVTLGVLLTLLLVASVLEPLTLQRTAAVTTAVVAVAGLLYFVFRRF